MSYRSYGICHQDNIYKTSWSGPLFEQPVIVSCIYRTTCKFGRPQSSGPATATSHRARSRHPGPFQQSHGQGQEGLEQEAQRGAGERTRSHDSRSHRIHGVHTFQPSGASVSGERWQSQAPGDTGLFSSIADEVVDVADDAVDVVSAVDEVIDTILSFAVLRW